MARKTKIVTISPDGRRDANKQFLITEKSAAESEKWAVRLISGLANSGMDIGPEIVSLGMGAVAAIGLKGVLTMSVAETEGLLDEMMQCVQILPDPKNRPDLARKIDDEDIEEVTTRLLLRSEVFEIHTGFSPAALLSKLGAAAKSTPRSPASPTSPQPSGDASPPDEQA